MKRWIISITFFCFSFTSILLEATQAEKAVEEFDRLATWNRIEIALEKYGSGEIDRSTFLKMIGDKGVVELLRVRAEQGDVDAQFNLGCMYDNGRGVEQSDEEARRWWRLAAEQGHSDAQFNVGIMYANGWGVEQNDEEACRWWRLAAEQGNLNAQYNLKVMYESGRGSG